MLKQECLDLVINGIKQGIANGEAGNLTEDAIPAFNIEVPKNRDFGDFAINVSCLCRFTKKSPLDTAKIILKNIEPAEENDLTSKETDKFSISLAGGYINFKIKKDALFSSLNAVIEEELNPIRTKRKEYEKD